MTTYIPPLCFFCARLREEAGKFVCDAYPDGIPFSALTNKPHYGALPGDNGVRFQLSAEADVELLYQIHPKIRRKIARRPRRPRRPRRHTE